MISVREADRILAGLVPPSGRETVPIVHANNRCLAVPLIADRDGPPFDRVAMDGYAVDSSAGLRSWSVQGFQAAGRPPLKSAGAGTAVEVATGAVLPEGCDAVVPYELTTRAGDRAALLDAVSPIEGGRNVHRRGADFRKGETILAAGTVLRSAHLHSLAAAGMAAVSVLRRPVWSLAVTGDELVAVDGKPEPWQIRGSNAVAIAGEARAWGLAPRDDLVVGDDRSEIRRALEAVLPGLDVLILTGGVSAGLLDLVPAVMADLGAETLFHKIAQRPGKPLWCGRIPAGASGSGVVVFGLPGNPVSSLFSFRRFVLPWLLRFEGREVPVRRIPVAPLEPPPEGMTVYLPWSAETGLLDWRGSGNFRSLSESTGFIEVEDARSRVEPKYYPWGGVW